MFGLGFFVVVVRLIVKFEDKDAKDAKSKVMIGNDGRVCVCVSIISH